MKSDFYNESLKNLSEYISRGITPNYAEDNGLQVLNQKCVRDGKISFDNSRLHDNKKKKVSDEKILKKNDILVNSTGVGTLGRVAQKYDDTIATVDSHITIVRPKKSKVDPVFLGYLLKQNQSLIESLAEGTTGQTELSRTQLGDLRFDLPVDKNIQRKIGEIMFLLDSKIEFNQRVNQTLESISQTLFKSWFLDFDPVKAKIVAKEQGEDPQLAAMMAISGKSEVEINQMPSDKRKHLAETANLFPEEMVESELGEIPKGWKTGKIGEVYTSKGGYAFRSDEFIEEGFPVVKIKNITNSGYVDLSDTQKVSLESTMNKDSFILRNGDVIMAMTGATIGKVGIIANHTNKNCFLNQRVAKFYLANKLDNLNWFVYLFFRREENTIAIMSMAQGSAQPNISTTGIDNVRAIMPNSNLLNKFNLIVDPLFKVWISNSIQSKKLSETRDILLPELLAGKLSTIF